VTNTREDDVVEAKVQPSIEMQEMTKSHLKAMEIKMRESNAATKKRRTTMGRATLMKGIRILDPIVIHVDIVEIEL
jgi:hypothetical protein